MRVTLVALALVLAGCAAEPEPPVCGTDGAEPCEQPSTAAPTTQPLPPAATSAPLPHHPSDGAAQLTAMLVKSFDAHQIPAMVYKPMVAGPNATVPVLLHSHGWAGTKQTAEDAFQPYLAAGFGVVSFDMRGHGEAAADSVARVHRMEYEIQDVSILIDEIATWDWVHLDGVGDPRIGALGGSYGGAYQLLTAAVDDRLDAIAPEITWNRLVHSLAPYDAPKSAWIDLLYLGAQASGTQLHQEIHDGYRYLQVTNDIPDGQEPAEPDLRTPFVASSPASYDISIPTLVIQGVSDTLFNFNEAAANYAQIKATGAPVRLVTHLNGHILNTDGTIPDPGAPQGIGVQPGAGPDPCGEPEEHIIPWYERHLIGLVVETGPEVCLSLEDGTFVEASSFPVGQTEAVELEDITLPLGARAAAVEVEIMVADAPTVIAGIPVLRGSAASPGPDAIAYFTLEIIDAAGDQHVVNSQVTPMRLTGNKDFEHPLMGVGVRLEAGDTLVLVARDRNDQYAHNEGRFPGILTLTGLGLEIPVVP